MRFQAPLVIVGTALAAATLAACGGSTTSTTSSTPTSPSTTTSPVSPSVVSTSGPASPIPGASGSAADISFAQLMIPHHEQAVQMADMALNPAYGASPQVQALATQIKAAQAPEIAQMQEWLTSWGAPSAMVSASVDAQGDMAGMDMGGVSQDGMMTEAQMSALAATKGQAFDQMWLGMMISHHQGAIAMAQDVSASSTNPQVKALAASVITGQQAEIDTMKALLANPQ